MQLQPTASGSPADWHKTRTNESTGTLREHQRAMSSFPVDTILSFLNVTYKLLGPTELPWCCYPVRCVPYETMQQQTDGG